MRLMKKRDAKISAEIIAEQCIAVRLRILSRAVTRIYNQALRPYGLMVSQMNILVAVSCLGEARQQAVCWALQLEKSTLSRDAGRMRSQGWLKEVPEEDGRSALLTLTPAGRKLLEKATPAWQRAQERATALLGEREIGVLGRAVTTLRAKNQTTQI